MRLPRLRGLLTTELHLLVRMWVLAAAALATGLWAAAVQFVPTDARAIAVPLVLLMDTAALGFYFIPSLVVLERSEGMAAAMRVTRARAWERLIVRLGALTAASLAAALVLLLASGHGPMPAALLGVLFTSLTFALLAYVLVGPFETLTAYMVRVPVVAVPLLLPALVAHLGLWDGWPLWLSPITAQMDLISGRFWWPGVVWQAVWIVALWALAVRSVHVLVRPAPVASVRRARRARALAGRYSTWGAIRSFARTDRASLLRDPLLVMIIAGVPAVAVAARLASTLGASWIDGRFGFDIGPHLPLVWALLLVLHTPLMFGSIVGLLFLEDRDARLLPAIATTRASLRVLAGYRLGALMLATALALPIGFAIAGVSHAAGVIGLVPAVVAASALAPVPALVMASFAPNRAAGMALLKVLGLPLYVPLASWFAGMPVAAAFGVLPSTWVLWSFWADSMWAAWLAALVCVAACGALSAVLLRRLARGVI